MSNYDAVTRQQVEAPFKTGPTMKPQLPTSLMRLARMRSYGYGAGKNVQPVSQPMALTAGSHGRVK